MNAVEDAKPLAEILQSNELRLDDLTKHGFRRTEARSAPRDEQGWLVVDPKKIALRYTNPDHWSADPHYNGSSRDHLIAICPASKEIIESWIEPRGVHATLELPAADCQIRGVNNHPHGDTPAYLRSTPSEQGCARETPKLPPTTALGSVIDLGEVFPKCAPTK